MKKTLVAAALGLAALLTTPFASAALSVADLSTSGDGLLTVDSVSGLAWLDVSLTRGMSLDEVANGSWIQQGFRLATSAEFDTLRVAGNAQPQMADWLGAWAAEPEVSAFLGGPTTVVTGLLGGDAPREDGLMATKTLMLTRDTQIVGGPMLPAPEWLSRAPWQWEDLTGPVITREEIRKAYEFAGGEEEGAIDWGQSEVLPSESELLQHLLQQTQSAPRSFGNFLRRRTEWVNPQTASNEWGVFLVKNVSPVPEPSALLLMGVGLVGLFALKARHATAV